MCIMQINLIKMAEYNKTRVVISLKDKIDIINDIESGMKRYDVMKKYKFKNEY